MRSALILAGGESRRFGGPKALAEIEGRPIIARVADALSSLADEMIVSVQGRDWEDRIRRILPRAAVAFDDRPGRGPIEGFRQGFRQAHGDVVLVAPCDAPFLRPPLYELLLEVLGELEAAVPRPEVLDPVRAVYRRSPVMAVLEASPDLRSPSALIDRLHYGVVGPDQIRAIDPDLGSFFDVNTRADLDDALRRTRPSEGVRETA